MENKRPKVSIGMPVWNGEDFIRLALDSLLAQDFKDFEIIISDNASTDNTKKICEEYMKKDSRIRYIRQKENIGADRNFNFVLNKARGEYFMWAAYDDLWDPSYISEMVKILDNNKSVILVSCLNEEIDENGNVIGKGLYRPAGIFPKGKIFKKAFTFLTKDLGVCAIYGLMRTSIIKKIGWPIGSKKNLNRGVFTADVLVPFRLIFEGDIYIIDKVLFHHRSFRKSTDLYLKSTKKLDIIIFFILKVLRMFFNVHGHATRIRKIIFGGDELNFYQKFFLFCVTLLYEFKMIMHFLYHYSEIFLNYKFNKDYRKKFINSVLKYNPSFKEK